jgi:hypothetical protein
MASVPPDPKQTQALATVSDSGQMVTMEHPPELVLEEASRAARALQKVIASKPHKVIMNGEQYLEFEDWQTVGGFYHITAGSISEPEYVMLDTPRGQVHGFKATSAAYYRGQEISRATAYCMDDEEKWSARSRYEWHIVRKDGKVLPEDAAGPSSEWVWEPHPNKPDKNRPRRQRVKVGEDPVPIYQLASMAQCVPLDSEILTRRGFQRHDAVAVGEEVLAYDTERDECRWVPLEAVNLFPVGKPMIRLTSRSLDVRCTEDHSWAIREFHGEGRSRVERRLKPIGQAKDNEALIVAATAESGSASVTPTEAAIMGWLITDGSIRESGQRSFRGHIDQANPRYVPEIRALVGNLALKEYVMLPDPEHVTASGQPWGKRECYRWTLPTELVTRLMDAFGARSREDLPGCVTRLSSTSRRAMLEAMLHADGHEIRGSGIWRFAKNNEATYETFQVLCTLEGVALGRQHARDDVQFCQATRRHRVLVRNAILVSQTDAEPTWCPTTSLGTWVMRQNGQVLITGNTRANAKALRNVLSRIVVLAGYKPTPAEELDGMTDTVDTGTSHREPGEDSDDEVQTSAGTVRPGSGERAAAAGAEPNPEFQKPAKAEPRSKAEPKEQNGGIPACPKCGTPRSVMRSRYKGPAFYCFPAKGGCGGKFNDAADYEAGR